MIHAGYLVKGLDGMARAHHVNTMAGHLGAAVTAGFFISEQHPDLEDIVCAGIQAELDRIIAGESVFSPREDAAITVGEMFDTHPEEQARPELVDGIAEALTHNIDRPRQSGHNVIFASIAIRAFTDYPDLARPAVVNGIRQLIADFDGTGAGSAYYGKQRGRIRAHDIPLPEDPALPPYADVSAMAEAVLGELVRAAGERRDGFGGLWHVINHAAALAELDAYGYAELARQGLPAHHQHLRLFRAVPNVADELGAETPTTHDPRTPEFWTTEPLRRERAHLTHRIKTLYGFDALARLVSDERTLRQANDKLRYLM